MSALRESEVNDVFFAALDHVRDIHQNCKVTHTPPVSPFNVLRFGCSPRPCCLLALPDRGVAQLSNTVSATAPAYWPSQPPLEIKQSPGRRLPNCLLASGRSGELRVGFNHFGGRQHSGLQCGVAYLPRRTANGVLLTCATPLYATRS